jgi:hypothetical protein
MSARSTEFGKSGSAIGLAKSVFSFPNPVNEVAARTVAAMVVALSLAFILTGEPVLLIVLAYGFLARVLTGPTLSPMGQLAIRAIVPLLGNRQRMVPGPPKRFAQSVGVAFSIAALVLYFAVDSTIAAQGAVGVLAGFAALEAGLGFCAGCFVFDYLMRWGVIPESVCRECVEMRNPVHK